MQIDCQVCLHTLKLAMKSQFYTLSPCKHCVGGRSFGVLI